MLKELRTRILLLLQAGYFLPFLLNITSKQIKRALIYIIDFCVLG